MDCASPKFCPHVKSTAWGISFPYSAGIVPVHVPLVLALVRSIRSRLSFTPKLAPGEFKKESVSSKPKEMPEILPDNGHPRFPLRQPERSRPASPLGLWLRRTARLALLAGCESLQPESRRNARRHPRHFDG